jgi:acyl carrier protein
MKQESPNGSYSEAEPEALRLLALQRDLTTTNGTKGKSKSSMMMSFVSSGAFVLENQKEMTREEFLLEMDEILGLRAGTLLGNERMEDLPNWDSTALIQLIVLAEEASGKPISTAQVVSCSTVADVLRLAGMDDNSSSQRNAQTSHEG